MCKCDVCVLRECGVPAIDINMKLGTTACSCDYAVAKECEHDIQMDMLGDILALCITLVVVYGLGIIGLFAYLIWGA